MQTKVVDIVVAKKGGSGKTLISLFKAEAAIKSKKNVVFLDLNDMNPDFSTILQNIFEAYEKAYGDTGFIKKLEDGRGLMGDIVFDEYELKGGLKIAIVYPRKIHRGSSADEQYMVQRVSSIDMQYILYKCVSEFLDNRNYDILISDTNTNYETIIPWYTNKETYGSFIESLPFLGSECVVGSQDLTKDSYSEIMEGFASDFAKKNKKVSWIISYVLPLTILISSDVFSMELEKFRYALDAMKSIASNITPNIIINAYVPTIGMPMKNRILNALRRLKSTFDRFIGTKREDLEHIILETQEIISVFSKYIKTTKQHNIKSIVSVMCSNVRELFVKQLKYELSERKRISNLFVMPVYDLDISDQILKLKAKQFEVPHINEKAIIEKPITSILKAINMDETIDSAYKSTPIDMFIAHKSGWAFLIDYMNRYTELLQILYAQKKNQKHNLNKNDGSYNHSI